MLSSDGRTNLALLPPPVLLQIKHRLPDTIIHAYAKFASLDSIDKNIIGKEAFLNQNRTSLLYFNKC